METGVNGYPLESAKPMEKEKEKELVPIPYLEMEWNNALDVTMMKFLVQVGKVYV